MSDFRTVKRVVRPRRFVLDERPLVAVSHDLVLVTRTGEVIPRGELPRVIATEPSSIVIVENAAMMVKQLDRLFGEIPTWNFKMTPVVRRTFGKRGRRSRPTEVHETVVGFFGFRTTRKDQPNRYHMPLDPLSFIGGGIRNLVTHEEEESELMALLRWGMDVQEWCQSQRLKVTTRNGGLAAALLKDPRFYLEPRRKVPRATNDRARDHLPGNYYRLMIPEGESHNAYYLDMTSAHHTAAATLTFPDANSLYARGKFRSADDPDWEKRGVWLPRKSPGYDHLIQTHGLFLLRVSVPFRPGMPGEFPPPYLLHTNGIKRKLIYVYSNELPLLETHKVEILGIEAAWTSAHADTGLNRYAQFARAEAAGMSEQRKRWGKTTLLSTYGMLAARPSKIEFGFKRGIGEDGVYFTPDGPLSVKVRRTSREIESTTANVIHRGMIEAEIRKQVLTYARDLTAQGVSVLSLYADSIIIDSEGPLPFIAPPWRIKDKMTHLRFFNPVTFESAEVTRFPGIPREVHDHLRLRTQFRAVMERERNRRQLSPSESAAAMLIPNKRRRGRNRPAARAARGGRLVR